MKRFKKITKILKSTDGAAVGIFVAILLIGLIVCVMTVVQTVYMPDWMKQREAEHMDEVANQFAQLKFSIDILSATEQNTPISTSITLGNKELPLPFFTANRAFGSLLLLSDECNIIFTTTGASSFSYSLGTIKYLSENAYYLARSYIYEAGALILSEPRGNIMDIKPAFFVSKDTNVNLTFTLVNISGIGGKTSVCGSGTYSLQTNFLDSNAIVISNLKNITITTNFQNSWSTFFNSTLNNSGLNYGEVFWVNSTDDEITIEFSDSITVDLTLKVIDICTSINIGWIK